MTALGAVGALAGGESSLVGKWRIETIRGAGAFDASKTIFEISPDGRVATTVGCNRIAGAPTIVGDRVRLGAMAATRMACPPPLDQLETNYLAALETARSWRIEGPTLTLLDQGGEAAVTLTRAE
jgi:heat shock protein HslJ